MKKFKKFFILIIIAISFFMTGCASKNVEGSLTDIMEKLYQGIAEDEKPMMLSNIELNSENFTSYAFTELEYKEAIASESMTGSIPHSVVLIRLEDASLAKQMVEDIEKNANPRKWICVEAENTYVMSKGDLVVLIMSNELAPKIKENFENL